ncbi:MAG: hypothetical protein H6R15_4012 [Proteobacteria bacterium]|nr:hypothetical protein [Pseudomonadota bacterium]
MRQLIIAICFFPLFAAAQASGPKTAEVVVDYRDGVYYGSLNLTVAAALPQVLEVLTDFDHMADFVPNLKSSKVLSHTGNLYRIVQQGQADFGPFSFAFDSERQIEVFPEGRLVSQRLAGSPKFLRSELRLTPGNAGTRLDYRVEMVPDRWLPSAFALAFVRHELAEQFMALGREMERRRPAPVVR